VQVLITVSQTSRIIFNEIMAQTAASLLNRRRLQDISELQNKPYPGITLHVRDNDVTKACLILAPEDSAPLHLTIHIHDRYPIEPPRIKIQSKISHPNVYQDYICASVLNTKEGYTPAYTLKGICIQLLSFFGSDSIEQDYGGVVVDLKQYARGGTFQPTLNGTHVLDSFCCLQCGYGQPVRPTLGNTIADNIDHEATFDRMEIDTQAKIVRPDHAIADQTRHLTDLPNELLVAITEFMEEETLFLAARAWPGFSKLLQSQNLIQIREMQCFTLKTGFQHCRLGVGVDISLARGRKVQSEFDYISIEAVEKLKVRTSVQGLPFSNWLPLPFSEAHWNRVKDLAGTSLEAIGQAAAISGPVENVLYAFMNDITVKLCEATSGGSHASKKSYSRYSSRTDAKSTLTHASEKAVESYYQLYHLLVTLATDNPDIAAEAGRRIKAFVEGDQSKAEFPNLGHLLVAMLIADVTMTSKITEAIIKEAITRNVVWMLDSRGAGMTGLSYFEPSEFSMFRLSKTYEASKTSYNLLMFAHLMRKTVKEPAAGNDATESRTLEDIREELFSRHGSPPAGTAAELAASIRRIQQVDSFPDFLTAMDVAVPTKEEFTRFLRRTLHESVDKGYSKWALPQEEALAIRLKEEPTVDVVYGMRPSASSGERYTFFPQEHKRKRSEGSERGGRGGRGRRRGYGRGRGRGHGGRGGW
jgi:ubiquitin-protein ligase